MAATQSSTQSDSQTQKSKIWQDKLGDARADTTEVTTEPFLIHHTKVTVITRDISNKTHGKERKKEEKKRNDDGDPKRSPFPVSKHYQPF